LSETDPQLVKDLQKLVESSTRGDPESPLLWTSKSTTKLAEALQSMGHSVSQFERVWEDLKIDFKGENYANLDELRAAIRETLVYMTPEWIASLTQYPYIMKALSVSVVN
jgi:Rhodopirellula transposase DDE domain